MSQDVNCFCCGRKKDKAMNLVDTRDGQTVFVGSTCFKKIKAAGEAGYPIKGLTLRLYEIKEIA